ncbi:hypothetical protein [Thiocystis violacea]|uniref:hypothetical protein n=1 Tax=Thiocystis violacea TaxID=13725 RepID=UPI001907F8D1|nr:hypothetical protein [Thiocystis violacea]MBK1721949.1 hypothetical protein [Thiocystis violacea]
MLKWRVKGLLTAIESDRKHSTEHVANNFVAKTDSVFTGLPKPKADQALEILKRDISAHAAQLDQGCIEPCSQLAGAALSPRQRARSGSYLARAVQFRTGADWRASSSAFGLTLAVPSVPRELVMRLFPYLHQ